MPENLEKKISQLYDRFLRVRFSCHNVAEPLPGDNLHLTTESPDISGAYSINHGRMKGWVDLGATQWFQPATRGLGIQHPNHYVIVP